ncbi:MAG: SoxR reducing system RseC family protein [Zoogloea sp.]|nr:SoxR reducing system RseC family protein [Zoogloea sp.]
METNAVVTRTEGRLAWVKLTGQQGGCGRCHEPGGCGGVQVTHVFKKAGEEFRLDNDIHAEPGQAVRVWVSDEAPLRASMLTYGLPLAGLLAGAVAGTLLAPSVAFQDAGGLAGGLGGLLLALLAARYSYRRAGWHEHMQVRLLAAASHCRSGADHS